MYKIKFYNFFKSVLIKKVPAIYLGQHYSSCSFLMLETYSKTKTILLLTKTTHTTMWLDNFPISKLKIYG
jgi:hypothetical protein